ncbi:hypothetical protein NKH95_01740 [Mesorhizobium sp. M0848]|uniref:hypothetical protein n=1 Tax=Mesorhizobium sp. M0848 TaxID=2957012 RepID=UPI00333C11E8
MRRFKKTGLGGFADDVVAAGRAASLAGRNADRERLRSLWLEYLEVQLPARGDEKLIDYLETRAVWREEEDWTVFRTVDEPCVAFTASVAPDGTVELIALAACDRFPAGSDEQWWQSVVRPRVLQL